MGFLSFLGTPLGYVMWAIFQVLPSYGWALLIFILVTRLAMFPLGIKQQKSQARMAAFQPKLQQLQKQYGKDKQRYQEEMMKLYEQEGASPTAGCLPMAIQMILLFGIIDVIYNPLKHLLHISAEAITGATTMLTEAGVQLGNMSQLMIIKLIQADPTAYDFAAAFNATELSQIQNFDMSFLGMNLGQIPTEMLWPLILIPIFSFGTQMLYTLLSMKQQKKNGQSMQGAMKWMMLLMPLMSLWFAFTMPAGVGLYWTASNVLMILQQLLLQKLYPPEKVLATPDKKRERNQEKLKAKREKMEVYQQQMAERGLDARGRPLTRETPEVAESLKEKEANRIRLAEARKRLAEKYGEDYKDD